LVQESWKFSVEKSICAGSSVNKQCSGELTFSKAVQFCKTGGARVCTAGELTTGIAKSTGCALDNKLVWTRSTCGEQPLRYIVGAGKGKGSFVCSVVDARFSVRCCSSYGIVQQTSAAVPARTVLSPSSPVAADPTEPAKLLSGPPCTLAHGVDFYGHNLNNGKHPAASVDECCQLCHRVAECTHFTFRGKWCWLKTSSVGATTSLMFTSGTCVGLGSLPLGSAGRDRQRRSSEERARPEPPSRDPSVWPAVALFTPTQALGLCLVAGAAVITGLIVKRVVARMTGPPAASLAYTSLGEAEEPSPLIVKSSARRADFTPEPLI